MSKSFESPSNSSLHLPYPPSWMDRLVRWIDQLPGPAWMFYLLGTALLALLANAIFWIDGSLPLGSIDSLNTIFAFTVLYWVGLYQYLTVVGTRALQSFQPLLPDQGNQVALIEYALVTLPAALGWLAIPLGFAFGTATVLGSPQPFGELVPNTLIPYIADILIMVFLVSTFFCVVFRSLRQLKMVRQLHSEATNINLLKLAPAHAFSGLTARTAVAFLVILIIGLLDPGLTESGLDILAFTTTGLLMIAIFVLPIIGMRDRLEEEKHRLLDQSSDLLGLATDQLAKRVRANDYHGIGETKDAIEALMRQRQLLEKIATWPWDPRTLRGFASSLLLPVLIWLVTRLLEGFF